MTEELQLFCEDMDEQLSIMEDTLVDMSQISLDQIDSEMINKLFRAMHTMKGNASMFGFDDIVSFAHIAENLLDEIRNDKINLTDELIELFLLVNDHSKMLIDLVVESCELDEEQLQYHDDLISQLQGYLQAGSTQSEATKSQNTVQTTIQNQQEDTQQQNISSYAVAMKLNKDFLSSGMDIISIIKYLNVIADVENINLDISDIPSLDQIDISKTYFNVV